MKNIKVIFIFILLTTTTSFISCQKKCSIEGIYKAVELVRMYTGELYFINIIDDEYLTWTYRAGYLPDKKYRIENDSIYLTTQSETFCLGFLMKQTCDSLIINNHGTVLKFTRYTEDGFVEESGEERWLK